MSVVIEQLRISDDGQSMFIDAHVNKSEQFKDKNIFVKKLTICTEEQITETISVPAECIYEETYTSEAEVTEIHLTLCMSDFTDAFNNNPEKIIPCKGTTLRGHLFFVFIECYLPEGEDIPCIFSGPTIGVTYDSGEFYSKAMNFTKALVNDCEVSKEFVDFILREEALKMAIETEHYNDGIMFYKMLREDCLKTASTNSIRCGCHG